MSTRYTALLAFDLSNVPPDATVREAKVRTYLLGPRSRGLSATLDASPVVGDWSESSRTLPALGNPVATRTISAGDVGNVIEWDVTALAATWVASPQWWRRRTRSTSPSPTRRW